PGAVLRAAGNLGFSMGCQLVRLHLPVVWRRGLRHREEGAVMAVWRRCLPIITVLLGVTLAPVRASADAATHTSEMRWGPFVVPAAVGDRPGVLDTVLSALPMPCVNCYLTGIK